MKGIIKLAFDDEDVSGCEDDNRHEHWIGVLDELRDSAHSSNTITPRDDLHQEHTRRPLHDLHGDSCVCCLFHIYIDAQVSGSTGCRSRV